MVKLLEKTDLVVSDAYPKTSLMCIEYYWLLFMEYEIRRFRMFAFIHKRVLNELKKLRIYWRNYQIHRIFTIKKIVLSVI